MTDEIEKIGDKKAASRKRSFDAWADYMTGMGDFLTQPIVNNNPRPNDNKDTLSSAQPVNTTPSASPSKTPQSEWVSLGKKVWEFFAAPIVNNSTTGTSGKPGGDGVGAPSLETPFQIDRKQLEKLIKEMQDILKKISEANMETEDEIRDAERMVMLWLIDYLKKQKVIREEGARDMKAQIIFRTKKEEELGKELIDTENLRIDLAKSQQFWGKVNKITTIATVAVTVAVFALTAFATVATGGATMGAFMSTMKVSQSLVGIASGTTLLVKSRLDKQVGEHKEKGMILQEAHSTEIFKVQLLTEQMHDSYGKSLNIAVWMRQLGENYRQASLDMISISPPAAPAA